LVKILLTYEPAIRLTAFAGVFVVMALWELLGPRRCQTVGRLKRWPGNLGIVAVDTVLVRLVFPVAAVCTAMFAEMHGWGLFHMGARPGYMRRCNTDTGPHGRRLMR
jgi:hypothetical protein